MMRKEIKKKANAKAERDRIINRIIVKKALELPEIRDKNIKINRGTYQKLTRKCIILKVLDKSHPIKSTRHTDLRHFSFAFKSCSDDGNHNIPIELERGFSSYAIIDNRLYLITDNKEVYRIK